MEREGLLNEIEKLFTNEDMKNKDCTYIVYQNRVSSLLVNLPLDISRANRKKYLDYLRLQKYNSGSSKEAWNNDNINISLESLKLPSYLFASENMNIFNFIADKGLRLSNNFCSKWVWIKDNEKIARDFVKIISRHRICEGFELVHTWNDDLLFIKNIKIEKHYGNLKESISPSLVQYVIKYRKSQMNTYVQTELYMEKESGHFNINSKKFSKRRKKKVKSIWYNERDFYSQLAKYIKEIDKFLFSNICTYHTLLMNALDKRVKNINYSFLNKYKRHRKGLVAYTDHDPRGQIQSGRPRISYVTYGGQNPLKSELWYFKGILDNKYLSVNKITSIKSQVVKAPKIWTTSIELQARLKILVLFEDMRKYMRQSYPALYQPYDKQKERLYSMNQTIRTDDSDINIEGEDDEDYFIMNSPEYVIKPEEISGEDIEFNIDLLLNNSKNLGIHEFNVPDIPQTLIRNTKFRDNYYSEFYSGLLKIFEDFSDYQIYPQQGVVRSQLYKAEKLLFVKLISKDQLFIIKIDTFKAFFHKSFQYIKKGHSVFTKATYYQINNVMSGLSYNESESILHDLNPDYHSTREWTKEYFDIEENVQIDFSEFGLDYYYEDDDEEWLQIEKNIRNIKDNFMHFINKLSYELLYSKIEINMLRNNYITMSEVTGKLRKKAFWSLFKINITDLVLLALDLKKFPFYESTNEEVKQFDTTNCRARGTSDADLSLARFKSSSSYSTVRFSNQSSPLHPQSKNIKNKATLNDEKSVSQLCQSSIEQSKGNYDQVDIELLEEMLSSILEEEFANNNCEYYISKEEPMFYSLEVSYSEK